MDFDGTRVSAGGARALSSNQRFQASDLPEAEAIRRSQQGDSAAFESIYRLHSRRVYALCLRMVANPAEAEDLTQDVFLTVFRKICTFQGASAFSTWLHRVAVNVVLMHLRRKKPLVASLDQITGPTEHCSRSATEIASPSFSLAGSVDRFSLENAVAHLTQACRTVFVLHDIHGFKHREIAAMMDCSVGTSKAQLHRARSRLRILLLDRFGSFAALCEPATPY